MKQKHRDIVVNGETYGWIAGYDWSEDGMSKTGYTIFKNKKPFCHGTVEDYTVTPAIIAEAIIKYNNDSL